MRNHNLIVALVLEGVGIGVIIDSYRMGIKTFADPGPGLFPFLLGILLSLLSLPVCILALKDLKKAKENREVVTFRIELKSIGAIMACLIFYFVSLEVLGFLLTSFVFLFVLFLMGYPKRWVFVSLFSAVLVVFAFTIFSILLQITFPGGPLR